MTYIVSPKRTAADDDIPVLMGSAAGQPWTQIGVTVFDENDNEVVGPVSGELKGFAKIGGTVDYVPFCEGLDFSQDEYYWRAEQGPVIDFKFTVTNLPANHTYTVGVYKWG